MFNGLVQIFIMVPLLLVSIIITLLFNFILGAIMFVVVLMLSHMSASSAKQSKMIKLMQQQQQVK